MQSKTKKDLWVEMSIREIGTQAHFAGIAFGNLDRKAAKNTDAVFSSIHSFLSHCAMVSKLLHAEAEDIRIGGILGVDRSSAIHNKKFRNRLEHYDNELRKWIRERGLNAPIGTYNIGPKSMVQMPNFVYVSHYDPSSTTFTFVDEDLDLSELHAEVGRIRETAAAWVRKNQGRPKRA